MTAYDEGFRARLRGEPATANPHTDWCDLWLRWADGWKAQDEHLRDRDDALASIGWFVPRGQFD